MTNKVKIIKQIFNKMPNETEISIPWNKYHLFYREDEQWYYDNNVETSLERAWQVDSSYELLNSFNIDFLKRLLETVEQ